MTEAAQLTVVTTLRYEGEHWRRVAEAFAGAEILRFDSPEAPGFDAALARADAAIIAKDPDPRFYAHPRLRWIHVDHAGLNRAARPEAFRPDLTITGSAQVQVLSLNGLGVVGGSSDNDVDGAELLRFSIDADAATDVSYFVAAAGNLDGDGLAGEATVEAFDPSNSSLGVVAVNDTGTKNVSAMFGGEPIGAFVVRANVDNLRIQRVTYAPCL